MEERQRLEIEVGEGEAGLRLDLLFARAATGLSRNRVQALIRNGHVRLDGATVWDPGTRVNHGALAALEVPPPAPAAPQPQALPLAIRYEDSHLIVVDKPAGLVVHPAPGNADGTLVNALLHHCGPEFAGIGGVARPGIVHRLDKETSGLLVVAKTQAAHLGLSEQFAAHGRDGRLERVYLALVWGVPRPRAGTIDLPLGRDPTNPLKRRVGGRGARPAVTHYRLTESFGEGLASAIECRLETGRTHQIRVHLAHGGHPLLGDPVYGTGFRSRAAKLDAAARKALERLPGQALHAAILGFRHPATGEALRFASAPPDELVTLTERLRALPPSS